MASTENLPRELLAPAAGELRAEPAGKSTKLPCGFFPDLAADLPQASATFIFHRVSSILFVLFSVNASESDAGSGAGRLSKIIELGRSRQKRCTMVTHRKI
jgi:hypothetical protein